jgi:hypothetical protein
MSNRGTAREPGERGTLHLHVRGHLLFLCFFVFLEKSSLMDNIAGYGMGGLVFLLPLLNSLFLLRLRLVVVDFVF